MKSPTNMVASTGRQGTEAGLSTADAKARADPVPLLFINTTEFFGPVMQVHSRIIKHLDREEYRVIVATNSRGGSYDKLKQLDGVDIRRYNLGSPLSSYSRGFWVRPFACYTIWRQL